MYFNFKFVWKSNEYRVPGVWKVDTRFDFGISEASIQVFLECDLFSDSNVEIMLMVIAQEECRNNLSKFLWLTQHADTLQGLFGQRMGFWTIHVVRRRISLWLLEIWRHLSMFYLTIARVGQNLFTPYKFTFFRESMEIYVSEEWIINAKHAKVMVFNGFNLRF